MVRKNSETIEILDETPSTEVATVDQADMTALANRVESLAAGGRGIFSSIPAGSFEDKLRTADALANALPMDEHLGEQINLAHFVVQAVEVTNTDTATGLVSKVPATRVVLVDADGTAYAGVSEGVFKSLENIVAIFGDPTTWESSIPVRVERQKGRSGFFFHTLKIG